MSILDNENIILEDDSYIVNGIKQWFSENACNITLHRQGYSYESLYDDFRDIAINCKSINEIDEKKRQFLLNMDEKKLSKFIHIDISTVPAIVTIKGNLSINLGGVGIPTNLFIIDKIYGDLDISFCEFDSTDGFPKRENITGRIFSAECKIRDNKYGNKKWYEEPARPKETYTYAYIDNVLIANNKQVQDFTNILNIQDEPVLYYSDKF